MAPHNVFQVAGDDEWISLAVSSDPEFVALAGELGSPEIVHDSRFATAATRKANEDALDRLIAAAVRDRDGTSLEQALQRKGVKACRVVRPSQLAEDEGLRHMEFFQWMDRPHSGRHPYKTWPFRFSGIDTKHRRRPPTLGEHTREVLSELLGLGENDLDRLEQAYVVGTVPLGS